MLEVKVERVVVYNNADLIVLLRSSDDERVLPIHVDQGQAHAISILLEGLTFPRPLTHDLLKTVIGELGASLVRAEICDLITGTFHARLILNHGGKEVIIDARPSDAIALALRCDSPIFVDDAVMNAGGVVVKGEQLDGGKTKRRLSQVENVEKKLAKAIEEERYEDAATLRDELKQLKENKISN